MELFDYYLRYMTELLEGKRPAPEGITLTAEDEEGRTRQITEQLASMGAADFVRACAAQDGEALPESLFDGDSGMAGFEAFLKSAQQEGPPQQEVPETPAEPDPDAGKHVFEVFLDCVAMDDGLVQYLIDVLKRQDWKEFYKLSQITTRMDLDPEEFLYWLGHREDYADDEERSCAVIMDGCLERLMNEGKLELAAALLSGDRITFDRFRCDAPELVHLPQATYDWFSRHYLDRDYPIRALMKWNGVTFPENRQ